MRSRIFVIITFFIGFLIITLFTSMLFLQKKTVTFLTNTQLVTQTNQKLKTFNSFLEHRVKLIHVLTSNSEFIDYVKTKKNKKKIESLFFTQADTHSDIFQLRYIDSNGLEQIRIDNYNILRLLKKDELQNKKNRYYFIDTMKLKKDEIYFSNIDLNIERGKIETKHIPTIRIAKPIIVDNKKYGILIININMSKFLNSFKEMSLHSMSIIYEDGNIIIDKNSKYNWSRDLGSKVKINDLYLYLPKNFTTYKYTLEDSYYLKRLPINTKNNIYLLITPKEFKKFEFLIDYIKDNIILFIIFSFLGIICAYFITRYIEKIIKRRIVFAKVKSNNVLINSVINSSNDLIFYKDTELNYIGCNKSFLEFCNKQESEVIGQSNFNIFNLKLAEILNKMDKKVLEDNKLFVKDEWVKYNDKDLFLQFKNIPFDYGNEDGFGVLTIAHDITKLQRVNERLQEESYKDQLTLAYNRKAYDEEIQDRLELYKRYEDIFCIAMIDIDDFKKLNDNYGHDCGDSVLIQIVNLTNGLTRKNDKLFRIGGEEFVIMFPKTNLQNAHIILEKIRHTIANFDFLDKKRVTISCGLIEVFKDDNAETIYKRVDKLLYKTKNNGKNGISTDS